MLHFDVNWLGIIALAVVASYGAGHAVVYGAVKTMDCSNGEKRR